MNEAISLFSQEGSDFIEARNLLLEDKIEAAYVNLKKRIRELEAENARLKKQCEHLACDVVSAAQDYSAPMSDCRICDYDHFCRRKPGQVEPDVDMCEEAVLKACDPKEAEE
jgi:predicted nuclease with TOPRIM domain